MNDSLPDAPAVLVRLVQDLLVELQGTAVTECELRVGSYRVLVHRSLTAMPVAIQAPAAEEADLLPASWIPVASPLTGIFYLTETPQSPPYVTVGMTILERQVVGLIESMKMYNSVESEVAGIVRAITVANGAVVERGQPLLYVEPVGDTR
jgi:acetyl-CoA carboxylase biotin carboxyl carrier protein